MSPVIHHPLPEPKNCPVEMGEKNIKREDDSDDTNADFEFAISETKFGMFNLLLLLVAMTSVFSVQFEMTSLSYVFPAAQCDLNLNLNDRGLINAILFAGMISSSFIWGSLIDVFGRRKILFIFHLVDCIFVLMATFAPSFPVLITAKFLGGFIINGPSTALIPYMSEFHATKYRSRVPLTVGLLYGLGNVILPLLAWGVLPMKLEFTIFNTLEFRSWNLFLLICALPTFISGVIFFLLPESPKYSMTKGDNEGAIKTFKKVFRYNTRKPPAKYPIETLRDERQIEQSTSFKSAWKQISPLFSSKYRKNLVLVCLLQTVFMMCVNSFRLWLPEIFQNINDYEMYHNETASFCTLLSINSADDDIVECSMNFNNSSVYINSVMVASTSLVGYVLAGMIVNKLGKKRLLVGLGVISGTSSAAIFFAPNPTVALVLISIFITSSSVCIDLVVTVVVDLFPTSVRASAFSVVLTLGRVGSLLGNLSVPALLEAGCAPLFFTQGGITIACTLLVLLLPKTDLQALG